MVFVRKRPTTTEEVPTMMIAIFADLGAALACVAPTGTAIA
jgi:hypothetical protein